MLIVNNKALKITNKWLNPVAGSGPTPGPTPPGPSFDEVTIGTQTWMAKNLAIDDGGEGIIIIDNVTANGLNMGTQYYYTYNAAIRVANSINGWHLPTRSEVETLLINMGYTIDGFQEGSGKDLKSTSGWRSDTWGGNGTDIYGFTGLPVGWITNNSLTSTGEFAPYWEAQSGGIGYYPVLQLTYSDNYTVYNNGVGSPTDYYCSIRLVKDAT